MKYCNEVLVLQNQKVEWKLVWSNSVEILNLPYCGSLFRDPHFLFALLAFRVFETRRNLAQGFLLPATMGLPPFPIRSLFLWVQDEDVPLSLLLKWWRGDQPESARGVLMLGLAGEFFWLRAMVYDHGLYLSSSSSKEGSIPEDHAWVLAQQLAVWCARSSSSIGFIAKIKKMKWWKERKFSLERRNPLPRTKMKNRSARENVDFADFCGTWVLRKAPHKPIYFVDDILTTGSTAKAAWKALKNQVILNALVLAYRKQPSLLTSCEAKGSLLEQSQISNIHKVQVLWAVGFILF